MAGVAVVVLEADIDRAVGREQRVVEIEGRRAARADLAQRQHLVGVRVEQPGVVEVAATGTGRLGASIVIRVCRRSVETICTVPSAEPSTGRGRPRRTPTPGAGSSADRSSHGGADGESADAGHDRGGRGDEQGRHPAPRTWPEGLQWWQAGRSAYCPARRRCGRLVPAGRCPPPARRARRGTPRNCRGGRRRPRPRRWSARRGAGRTGPGGSSRSPSSSVRISVASRRVPRAARALTVPSGTSRRTAISRWVSSRVVGQLEDQPFVLRQSVQGGPDLGGVGVPLGGLPPVLADQTARRLDVDHRVPASAQRVDRATVRDREQPAREPHRRVVAICVAPRRRGRFAGGRPRPRRARRSGAGRTAGSVRRCGRRPRAPTRRARPAARRVRTHSPCPVLRSHPAQRLPAGGKIASKASCPTASCGTRATSISLSRTPARRFAA